MSISSLTNPTAGVLIIGNEILSGQTEDTNLNYIARCLQERGILVQESRFVSDYQEDIVYALNALRKKYAYVFTTGGIGPTHDDITAAAVAAAFDLPLVCNLEAAELLMKYYPNKNILAARLKMSEMPYGALLIHNPLSAAPGFTIENVYVLAGVPRIMQAMFEGILPKLQKGQQRYTTVISDQMTPESAIAHDLAMIQQQYPHIEIGSYPQWTQPGEYNVRIVVKGLKWTEVVIVQQLIMEMFHNHGGNPHII